MLMVEASANLVNIDEQTQEEKHLHMLGTSSRRTGILAAIARPATKARPASPACRIVCREGFSVTGRIYLNELLG